MADSVIRLDRVWAMLESCAPGYSMRATDHHYWVTYQRKTYRALPLGKHGSRKNAEVETGHVRSMCRHLGLEECARRELPEIW